MTLKRVQVMLLPIKSRALKLKCDCESDSTHHYACGMRTQSNNLYLNGDLVHLYFLSEDKIEERDWCYDNGIIYQIKDKNHLLVALNFSNAKKIIATTNKSLVTCKGLDSFSGKPNVLPQPSEDFIRVFVTEYNKGNNITFVDVEYTNRCCGRCDGVHDLCSADTECDKHGVEGCETCFGKVGNILKVNSKNEISIKKIKDVWTRDEVIKILGDLTQSVSNKHRFGDGHFNLLKWIEDNL